MSALLSRYKNEADIWLPRLPASQRKITCSAKQNYPFFRLCYRAAWKFFSKFEYYIGKRVKIDIYQIMKAKFKYRVILSLEVPNYCL